MFNNSFSMSMYIPKDTDDKAIYILRAGACDPYASLGQRRGLSDKDVSKLNEMYEQDCNESGYLLNFDRFGNYIDELIDYFQGNIQDLFG